MTGGDCQKRTPLEMLLFSAGGLNALSQTADHLQVLFPSGIKVGQNAPERSHVMGLGCVFTTIVEKKEQNSHR